MLIQMLHSIHLLFVFLLVAVTFSAFSNSDPASRKKILMQSGIFSLIVLFTGFGLLGVYKWGFPHWAMFKLVSWLVLSALAGLAYRFRSKVSLLGGLAVAAITLAIILVEIKPA